MGGCMSLPTDNTILLVPMSTKWSTETLGKDGSKTVFGALLKDESRILLLRGKNVFGDFVYCYLKVAYPDIERLHTSINGDASFNLHDFGEVLAAGKGEPPADVKAEIAVAYPTIGSQSAVNGTETSDSSTNSAPIPIEKKNWDEY